MVKDVVVEQLPKYGRSMFIQACTCIIPGHQKTAA
jgi:hypothetical protein